MKLSIITINYNNCDGLAKTIASVLNQSFTDFEYLIIDGNSTDGSKTLIENHAASIEYWVSEQDSGIYDAMNKGILKATGTYCMFLNSGDYLLDATVLEQVFKNHPTEDILYGDLKSDFREYRYPKQITLNTFFKGTIPHQAAFIKRQLFTDYGLYDQNYPIIADWLFFVKVVMIHNVNYKHLELYISFFEHGGVSTEHQHHAQMTKERTALLMDLFPKFFPDYLQMSTQIDHQQKALNAYDNSRLVQWVRTLQTKVLKNR